MLEERREIRARAQGGDAQVGAAARLLAGVGGVRVGEGPGLAALPDAHLRLGVLDVPSDLVDEPFEGVRAAHVQVTTIVRVAVQVDRPPRGELVGVGLHPFRGSEQRGLFTVPGGVDDRAARRPPLPQERPERPRFLEQRRLAGKRVLGAVHPRVVVVATDDPRVRLGGAGDAGDHVVQRLRAPVGLHPQVHLRGPGADVVSDPEPAAPAVGRGTPSERGEQRLRIGVRDRQHGNLGDRLRLLEGQPLRVLRGSDAGRERIAGIDRHVHHAAALHPVHRPPGSLRVHVALSVAIVPRVREDEAAHGAVFGGDFRLDAAPRSAIARDYDRALDRHPHSVQLLVVRRNAVVDVHERRGDVAVGGVGIVRRELLRLLGGRRIARDGWLLKLRAEPGRFEELHRPLLGRGEEHVEGLDARVEAEALELRENPFGIVVVVRRADVVGPRRETAHVLAHGIRARDGAEFRLPFALDLGGLGAEAAQVVVGRRGSGRRHEQARQDIGDHGCRDSTHRERPRWSRDRATGNNIPALTGTTGSSPRDLVARLL